MIKIKKIKNKKYLHDNFIVSGFYFLSLALSLVTLVMQSVGVEVERISVPFSFISLVEYAFSNSKVDILLIFVSIFYIATLLFSIRGLIICIKSWICQVIGKNYSITFFEKSITLIVLVIGIFLLFLWIILQNGLTIYYGVVVYLFMTILNICFLYFID